MKKQFFSAILIGMILISSISNVFAQESKIFQLSNLEADYAITLLPDELKKLVKPVEEQNGILAIGTIKDLKAIEDLISKIDIPIKQVELEVRVIELQRNALRNSNFFRNGGFVIGQISNGLSLFDFSKDTWNLFNSQVSYLERYGFAHLHAYPKVLSLSGRTASININTNNNLVLGSGTGVSGGEGSGLNIGVAQTQRLASIKAGTNLLITPFLGKDGLITSKIVIEISDNSGITSQNGVVLPTITTRREIDTNVQMKDGQTVAIGGLILNNKSVNRQGLPFLTQIPILGDLVSNRNMNKNQSELLILITPRIKDTNVETITLKDIQPKYIENKYYIDKDEDKLPWFKKIFTRAKKNAI